MSIKQRLALWRKRRHEANGRITRLNQKIKTRLVRLAARPALAAYLARTFDLRYTSGWRSVAHNAAVGGVPNSWHTRGSRTKPGAVDLVGTMANMQRALSWARAHVPNLAESMIHDVGSGQHLHLGGTGVANWRMPKRGYLKKWRASRETWRNRRKAAEQKIAKLKRSRPPKKVSAKGIDVSVYQGTVDYGKVKRAGYKFVIVKASEGEDFRDSRYLANVAAAHKAGLIVGAYHFLRPRAGRSGAVEARFFHDRLRAADVGKGKNVRPVIDIESNSGLSNAAVERYVIECADELVRLGHAKPIIYTFPSFLEWSSKVEKYPLWVAHFDVKAPRVPSPWKSYAIWQKSSTAKVPGVTGHCDVNVCPDITRILV